MSGVTEATGWMTMADGTRLPLTSAECNTIWRQAEAAQAKRAADMPDEKAAIRAMTDAFHRLKELGWAEAMYCPKDGSEFDAIEPGSSGIHRCHYQGEWPTGSWWLADAGDLWPSNPVLYRVSATATVIETLPAPPVTT